MTPRHEAVLQYAKVILLAILAGAMTWFAYTHR